MALCVALFGLKAYEVWSEGESPVLKTGNAESRQVQTGKKPVQGITERKVPPESNYEVVMGKNLFSPKRIETKPETGKQDVKGEGGESPTQKEMEVVLKGIMLFGVVIADDYTAALVTDIGDMPTANKRGRRPKRMVATNKMKWVKVGDTLGDFKVAEITNDRVLLKAGSDKYDLLLYDKDKPKIRVPIKPSSKPVVVSAAGKKPGTTSKTPEKGALSTKEQKKALSTLRISPPRRNIPMPATGVRRPARPPK